MLQHGTGTVVHGFKPALLKAQLDFFLGGMKGNGALETQGLNSTEVKLSTISHPLEQVSEIFFSHDIARKPGHPATGGDIAPHQ